MKYTVALLYLQVCPASYVTLKRTLQALEGPQGLLPPFKGEHLEQEPVYT